MAGIDGPLLIWPYPQSREKLADLLFLWAREWKAALSCLAGAEDKGQISCEVQGKAVEAEASCRSRKGVGEGQIWQQRTLTAEPEDS